MCSTISIIMAESKFVPTRSKVLISSVSQITPSSGTNANRLMHVINGEYWSRQEPPANATHVCLVTAQGKDGKEYLNVEGFTLDTRMPLAEKIALITSNDAGYSMAIATLLK